MLSPPAAEVRERPQAGTAPARTGRAEATAKPATGTTTGDSAAGAVASPVTGTAAEPSTGTATDSAAGTAAEPITGAVAIVGASGALGFGLAVRLGRAGMPVVIGSREAERAALTASRAREAVPDGRFEGMQNSGAVRDVEAVILSVPFESQTQVLESLRGALRPGQLLIDATVPLTIPADGGPARTLGVPQGSAAQRTLAMTPAGVGVVSALHTVSAGSLSDPEHPLDQDVLLCGDSRSDKRRAARLIERIEGLRCVDCGTLEAARITEALTALLIAVKTEHKVHPGIRLTGLPDGLWD